MDLSGAKDYITYRLVKELPKDLLYHGAHHTFDVVKAIRYLCRKEKIGSTDQIILITAAYFHDAGFLYKYENNESLGARIARESLINFDYSEGEILEVEKLIIATHIDIQPSNLLEKIMCDADHDYFGRSDYPVIASNLEKELRNYGTEFSPKEWVEVQIRFLENKHRYYTGTALKEREPIKLLRIESLREQLKDFKS